jgi:hypothetical protein
MRIYFSNLKRAKKAAKALVSAKCGIRLCDTQRTVAKLAGYRDWHDLVTNHNFELSNGLTAVHEGAESHRKIISLTVALSAELDLSWGDALYALSRLHLPGVHINDARDYEAIWLNLFEHTQGILGTMHSP